MSIHACILGATGFGGGELMRLLAAHPDVQRVDGSSRSAAGKPFQNTHPHLHGIVDGAFVAAPDWKSMAESSHPVLFAAMPHGEFAAQWRALAQEIETAGLSERLTVIDLSGDFRLHDADTFARHYGHVHPCPEWLGRFHYGLPECKSVPLDANAEATTLIANPGCFATAVQLALLPLRELPDPGLIAVAGITGSSGSGAQPSATTHHPTRANDFRAYKLAGHQHLGEVEQLFEDCGGRSVSFIAHSAPMVRGIFVTAQFALPQGSDAAGLAQAYAEAYATAPFVRLVEGSPRVAQVVGSNFCDIGIQVNGDTAIVMTALDNLVKGMAGQAVQNMNLALGLPETAGLMQAPLYP